MKNLIILLAPLFLVSCSGNHSHDGKYKASVFNSTMTWVYKEELELQGNVMYIRSASIGDNAPVSEYRTSCEQFDDRLEFKGKDGITVVARFDKDGNIKYGDYTYKKVIKDSGNVSEAKTTSLSKKEPKVLTANASEPKTQENFFTGTKSFCSQEREDDCIEITIKENGEVSIFDFTDGGAEPIKGYIQGATIVDANGMNLFIKYKAYHLYMKRGDTWVDFDELQTP